MFLPESLQSLMKLQLPITTRGSSVYSTSRDPVPSPGGPGGGGGGGGSGVSPSFAGSPGLFPSVLSPASRKLSPLYVYVCMYVCMHVCVRSHVYHGEVYMVNIQPSPNVHIMCYTYAYMYVCIMYIRTCVQ